MDTTFIYVMHEIQVVERNKPFSLTLLENSCLLEQELRLAKGDNRRYAKGNGLQTRDSNTDHMKPSANEGRKISPIVAVIPIKRRYQLTDGTQPNSPLLSNDRSN